MRIRRVAVVTVTLACVWLLGGSPHAAALQDQGGQDRAAALRTFTQGVERYAALRARYAAPLPPFDARRDPWSLQLSRQFLASAIRTARRNAAIGDIFTPPVVAVFRTAIAEASLAPDDEGTFSLDLAANEPVPAWALEEAPATLVERLPPLPHAIEYRLVGGALILWDAHAGIVIDAIPDALMPR